MATDAMMCPVCGERAATHNDPIDNVPVCDACGEQTADPAGPQSCYPVEIATLREMLEEIERDRDDLAEWAKKHGEPVPEVRTRKTERRLEALRTAIEALGGAL